MKQLLLLLSLIVCLGANAQNKKAIERSHKFFEALKKNPLYVVLDVEDQKHIEKLKHKQKWAEIENYKRLVNSYNENVKDAVSDYLNIFPSIKYITSTEFKEIKTKDLKSVNILSRSFTPNIGSSGTAGFNSVTMQPTNGSVWTENKMENIVMDTTNVVDQSIVNFISNFDGEPTPILSQSLNKLFCSRGEVYYAVRAVRRIIDDAINEKTTSDMLVVFDELKTRTLLINKNNLSAGLTSDEIKKVYPNPFKIITNNEFEIELTKSNPDVILLVSIPYMFAGVGIVHTFYDTSNETIMWPDIKKCYGPIEKKHFAYYLKKHE